MDVDPLPGALVVNLGDLMQRWTNGRFKSTVHRVLPPAPGMTRQCIGFFLDANYDAVIEPIRQLGEKSQYLSIVAGEHKLAKFHVQFVGESAGRRLRGSFAGLWGLGRGEDDSQIIKQACERPEEFVLKPQREGGGHNFYGADVAKKLKELTPEERSAYILMQRILPGLQPSVMSLGCSKEIDGPANVHLSEHAGHLVRTKAQGVDEGGVAAGYAVISGPFLT
eukprot:s1135_g1.t1